MFKANWHSTTISTDVERCSSFVSAVDVVLFTAIFLLRIVPNIKTATNVGANRFTVITNLNEWVRERERESVSELKQTKKKKKSKIKITNFLARLPSWRTKRAVTPAIPSSSGRSVKLVSSGVTGLKSTQLTCAVIVRVSWRCPSARSLNVSRRQTSHFFPVFFFEATGKSKKPKIINYLSQFCEMLQCRCLNLLFTEDTPHRLKNCECLWYVFYARCDNVKMWKSKKPQNIQFY